MSTEPTPFQQVVNLTLTTTNPRVVPPAGQRVVVEYINVSGSVTDGRGPVQPLITLNVGLRSTNLVPYYFFLQQSALQRDQYSFSGMTALHAEEIFVGFGYAGATPSAVNVRVSLSGHFVDA